MFSFHRNPGAEPFCQHWQLLQDFAVGRAWVEADPFHKCPGNKGGAATSQPISKRIKGIKELPQNPRSLRLEKPLNVTKPSLCLMPTLSPAQGTECHLQGWGHSSGCRQSLSPDRSDKGSECNTPTRGCSINTHSVHRAPSIWGQHLGSALCEVCNEQAPVPASFGSLEKMRRNQKPLFRCQTVPPKNTLSPKADRDKNWPE